MKPLKPIHTLNARGHLYLELIKDYFSLSPLQMNSEIMGLRAGLEQLLNKKEVNYAALKGALTPDSHRKEIAFVFDIFELQDVMWYGLPVFEHIMPLIDRKSSHSFLMGDFIGSNKQQDMLYKQFCSVFTPAREFVWRHSGLLYLVYINNLTDKMIKHIHFGLIEFAPYVGFVDCTYHSAFKTHISSSLSNVFVKHKNTVIQRDPNDESDTQDHNTSGYPFNKFDYVNRSVNDIHFGALLSYKIERPIYKGFEEDEELSLNYITLTPTDLKKFDVSVADAKAEYLRKEKADSLERAGLQALSASELAALIKSKIADSYVYNLRVNEYGARLFNVIIEISAPDGTRTRLMCGLQLHDEEQRLSLITMF